MKATVASSVLIMSPDFLGVTSSATRDEIIKAYRKKSRVIHPDKAKQAYIASKSTGTPKPKNDKQKQKPGVRVSKGPSDSEIRRVVKQANERFARLGVVQDILKGPDRERYDYFLKHGFPKWRGSGYYYARFRPGLGTVLLGLFLVGGGAVHYVALYIGWKRQKQFVDHFVRDARRRAWGDESGITGIPGVNAGTSGANLAADTQDAGLQSLNRRQRRMQDKENRKGKGVKEGNGGSTEPASSPSLERRRVVAENGKVLVVDSAGNVYLEEETEDGGTEEHLLDVRQQLSMVMFASMSTHTSYRPRIYRNLPSNRRSYSDCPCGFSTRLFVNCQASQDMTLCLLRMRMTGLFGVHNRRCLPDCEEAMTSAPNQKSRGRRVERRDSQNGCNQLWHRCRSYLKARIRTGAGPFGLQDNLLCK